jgi:hypothetical protein
MTDPHHPAQEEVVVIEHDPHATLAPGPPDVRAWTAGAVGILLGLLVAACFVVAAAAARA